MNRNSISKGFRSGFSVLVLALLAFVFLMPSLAYAAWYDSNWLYRKPVTISGSGSEQSDFQVKVTVGFVSGKMNSDFSDIRFTSSNGISLIDHWRQSYTASTTADFWVEVTTIPTSGTTIYMYYGNSGAGSDSNGVATFEFFDDFNDNSLDTEGENPRWKIEDGANWVEQNNRLEVTAENAWHNILSNTDIQSAPIIFEWEGTPWTSCN